jgi:hypothetical protein
MGAIDKRYAATSSTHRQYGPIDCAKRRRSAEVMITQGYDVTTNDEKLARRAIRSLRETAGGRQWVCYTQSHPPEDVSAYQKVAATDTMGRTIHNISAMPACG